MQKKKNWINKYLTKKRAMKGGVGLASDKNWQMQISKENPFSLEYFPGNSLHKEPILPLSLFFQVPCGSPIIISMTRTERSKFALFRPKMAKHGSLHFGPFQTKLYFLLHSKAQNWILVRNGSKGPKIVQNKKPFRTMMDPFGPLWDIAKSAIFGHLWSKRGPF